jgi:predicted MFS family arabinose efflux permease
MIFTPNLIIALIATVISFSTLYIPQPMLPLLAESFGVSAGEAGLLMTVAMLPLAIAPSVYGYFLQAIPAKLMLTVALALLALDQVCFYFADEFWHLIVLRLLQGLLLPAIFTALMTYCASMVPAQLVRRAIGFYIGATILGGFSGRLMGGVFASSFDWRSAFVVMGLMQLIPLLLLTARSEKHFAGTPRSKLSFHVSEPGLGILRVFRDIKHCSVSSAEYRCHCHALYNIVALPWVSCRSAGIVFQ